MDFPLLARSGCFLILIFVTLTSAIKKCEYDKTSCSCVTEEGVIDLKPLSQSEPYSAEYKAKNERFYWDPCKDFTMGTITSGAIQVQVPLLYYDIGAHDNAGTTVNSNGQPIFYMVAKDGARTVFVTCICTDDFSFTYIKEDPTSSYLLELKSPYCCPGYKGGNGDSGLSVGSIMCITFFSLLVTYILLGTVFQIAVKKASGKERLPNYVFWLSLPGLIKDGVLFSISGCKKSSSYSSI
ncbi:cation-dependent mannose-6-phosphate receptor [Biomphalaria glabrata]|nr:cation-dependent mannose-6-phosphate receptor [Biomphalaria glabrata]